MFQKLTNLLSERVSDKKYLREAEQTKQLQRVWEEKGILLFPENLRAHVKKYTRVIRVKKDDVVLAVGDMHTKNALTLKQREIQDLFEQETGVRYQVIRLKNHQT